jgi:FtsX-like permease family
LVEGVMVRSIWMAVSAEGRRRWGTWLALVLLVTLVGGTVLAGVTAARRTEAAFPSYAHRYAGDEEIFSIGGFPPAVDRLQGVHVVSTVPGYITGPAEVDGKVVPSNFLNVFALNAPGRSNAFQLRSGRLPVRADEILVGFSLQQQYGLHLGSTVMLQMYAKSQAQALFSSNGNAAPTGAAVRFHVVGFEASIFDFPSNQPTYSLFVSRAFGAGAGRGALLGTTAILRLDQGAAGIPRLTYELNHHKNITIAYTASIDSAVAAIEGSIRPQVVGWWIFALLTALAGIALVGQALARQSLVERTSFPTLSALGFTPAQLFGVGMARAGVIGLAGALGAIALAVIASPLTPVGEARIAELSPGFAVDALVTGLGSIAIVAMVLLLGAFPSWRASQARVVATSESDPVPGRSSLLARAAATAGAPASMLIGIRHAVERGRGRGSVPVATAIVGSIAAVAALVATTVFGASLSSLLSTPRLYGQTWQVDLSGFNEAGATAAAKAIARDPAITHVTYGVAGKFVLVNGVSASALIVRSAKGPLVFAVVDGHIASRANEISVGTQTLAAAHGSVGSSTTLSVIGPTGRTSSAKVVVAGTVALPPSINQGGLGDGVIITVAGAYRLICGAGPRAARCDRILTQRLSSSQFQSWGMAIETRGGAAGAAAANALEHRYAMELNVLTTPTNLVNFGQSINFPLLLGGTLALFGAATVLHLLLVSVSRRRRELALLKVLGFLRRQSAGVVGFQAITVALIALVAGIPVGIAVGNVVWQDFAHSVGAVRLTVVPVAVITAIGAGVLATCAALAVVPAVLAARARPAMALHEL